MFNKFSRSRERRGATTVEMSIVGPVFLFLMAGFMEFGHVYMTVNLLNGAASQAARAGVTDGVPTEVVYAKAQQIVSAALPSSSVSIQIKDATPFDGGDSQSSDFDPTDLDVGELEDIELANAESRQLFLVRLEVDYDDVGIVGPYLVHGVKLSGQAVSRHE